MCGLQVLKRKQYIAWKPCPRAITGVLLQIKHQIHQFRIAPKDIDLLGDVWKRRADQCEIGIFRKFHTSTPVVQTK